MSIRTQVIRDISIDVRGYQFRGLCLRGILCDRQHALGVDQGHPPVVSEFFALSCHTVISRGSGIGGGLATFRLTFPSGVETEDGLTQAEVERAARGLCDGLLAVTAVTAVHIGLAAPVARRSIRKASSTIDRTSFRSMGSSSWRGSGQTNCGPHWRRWKRSSRVRVIASALTALASTGWPICSARTRHDASRHVGLYPPNPGSPSWAAGQQSGKGNVTAGNKPERRLRPGHCRKDRPARQHCSLLQMPSP